MGAGSNDVAFAGLIAESAAQQVGHLPARRKRLAVARVTHVSQKADQVVLVRPDVPLRPAFFGQVGAQIAVVELALQQFADGVVELGPQVGVAGVDPGQGGGMEPLAHVLAVVGLPAGPLAKTLQQPVEVDGQQTVDRAVVDAHAEHSL